MKYVPWALLLVTMLGFGVVACEPDSGQGPSGAPPAQQPGAPSAPPGAGQPPQGGADQPGSRQ